jgi:hypothetical protein
MLMLTTCLVSLFAGSTMGIYLGHILSRSSHKLNKAVKLSSSVHVD